jgi:alpha-L-fucosidase
MFIHWGLYSQIAGEWHGKHFYGISEWIMRRAKIPVSQYENVARNLNPVNYSAASWVRVAKRAGVNYLVITAKHHDGFAMYASRANKFNIVDATPYNRDPLYELCNVARDEGLKIGFYYS